MTARTFNTNPARFGAAVVVKSGELAGIVTVTDICSALAEVLKAQFSDLPTT